MMLYFNEYIQNRCFYHDIALMFAMKAPTKRLFIVHLTVICCIYVRPNIVPSSNLTCHFVFAQLGLLQVPDRDSLVVPAECFGIEKMDDGEEGNAELEPVLVDTDDHQSIASIQANKKSPKPTYQVCKTTVGILI